MIRHFDFPKPIELKSGTKVTAAWIGESPIIMVDGTSREGTTFQSRFDLQKVMFIDPMPDAQDPDDALAITESVKAMTFYQ